MAQKSTLFGEKIVKGGYWNYKDLYGMLYGWLKDHGYSVSESEYKEKLSGGAKEIFITWKAGRKVTDYFKYEITLDWHIMGLKDAEVEMDGKKVSTNKGEVEIKFGAMIIRDYESRWEDKPLNKFLRGLYENYVIRTTVEEYEGDLIGEAATLVGDAKKFLQM